MVYTNIFCTCNASKEFNSARPVFSFKEEEETPIFNYIENHLSAFFDGSHYEKKKKFKSFYKLVIDKGLINAINCDNTLYAMVQQIPSI